MRFARRALLLGLWAATAALLSAQDGSLAYVQTDRQPVARLWEEAEKALAEGREAEALSRHLEILAAAADDVVPAGPEVFVGVERAVCERWRHLPPALLVRARRRQSLPVARLLRRRAAPEGEAALWRAVRRYPAAAAGPALEALADRAWERGDRALALRTYLRLWETCRPAEHYPEVPWPRVLAKAAFLAAQEGHEALLQRLRREAAPWAEAPVRTAAGTRPLGQWLAALRPHPPPGPSPPRSWPLWGGAPGRTAVPLGPSPPLKLAWVARDRVSVSRWEAADLPGPATRAYNPIQPVFPVWADGTVYYTNGRWLAAVRLRDGTLLASLTFRDTNPMDAYYNPHQYRHLTVAPGMGLYVVTEVDPEQTNRPTQRRLVAWSLPAQGTFRRLWQRGGPEDPDAVLARAFLTGSPLCRAGVVYVGGTVRGNDDRVHLFAFRGRDGRLLWRRFLCAGAGRRQDPRFRRVLGRLPEADPLYGEVQVAAADGFLYVSTNMGVVACLERGDGAIRWLYRYRRRSFPQNPSAWPPVTPMPWLENALFVTSERLVVTPRDSDALLVLRREPMSGRVLEAAWPKTGLRREYLHLLGARNGVVYLLERIWRAESTRYRVAALALGGAPRRRLWTFPLPHTGGREVQEYPVGRGLVTARYVWVPTNKALHVLDRLTGRRVTSAALPADWSRRGIAGPGNLVPVPGGLLAAGAAHLACFRAEESK